MTSFRMASFICSSVRANLPFFYDKHTCSKANITISTLIIESCLCVQLTNIDIGDLDCRHIPSARDPKEFKMAPQPGRNIRSCITKNGFLGFFDDLTAANHVQPDFFENHVISWSRLYKKVIKVNYD